ncbi:MAG: orotate phosphoribosyltransferase [Crenarchaeota archaeon]|nr:orotate phosphoribosyltransferase [Thermoproteota archaeon]MDW8033552.1 orotate phosphoribosyltransferase [Nitrososphaerota archaeon]
MTEFSLVELVKDIYLAGGFKIGEFKLTSGGVSPYYVDLRILISRPKVFERLVDSYINKMRSIGEDFDIVAGVETAGIPIATLISHKTGLPMIYARSMERDHGTGRMIEGELIEGSKVVVIDDVLTTGKSIENAVRKIRDAGGRVTHAIVFLDRLQNGVKKLSESGIAAYSVIDIKTFLKVLSENKLIRDSEYEKVMRYVEEFSNVEK